MKKKYLNITLKENVSFKELICKIEKTLNISLHSINKDGRLIARGHLDKYLISVIDRYDDLAKLLCDENYMLRFEISYNDTLNYIEEEREIKYYLKMSNIQWIKGVWRPTDSILDIPREFFPNKSQNKNQ